MDELKYEPSRKVIFVLDLIQDYNVQINIIHTCLSKNYETLVIVTDKFFKRDIHNVFRNRIAGLSILGAKLLAPLPLTQAIKEISKYSGVVFTSSESSLPNHHDMYCLVNSLSKRFKTITLQHGFENVGLIENRNTRDVFSYESIEFASDEIWGYTCREKVDKSLNRVYKQTNFWNLTKEQDYTFNFQSRNEIILCDSIHSPKFTSEGKFLDFVMFAKKLASFAKINGKKLILRPHPAKFAGLDPRVLALIDGVDARPLNETDFKKTLMLISTASTICVDATMRNIPCFLWSNSNRVNIDNFNWLDEFDDNLEVTVTNLETYAQNSKRVLIDQYMSDDASCQIENLIDDVCERFKVSKTRNCELCILSDNSPTFHTRFLLTMAERRHEAFVYNPVSLKILENNGVPATDLYKKFSERLQKIGCKFLIIVRDLNLPKYESLISNLKNAGIRTVLFLDDDIQSLSPDLEQKYKVHRSVEKSIRLKKLLKSTDLSFTSNKALNRRISQKIGITNVINLESFGIGNITKKYPAVFKTGSSLVFGYAGVGHQFDLELILPQVAKLLDQYPETRFEFFGITPPKALLKKFGKRISFKESNIKIKSDDLSTIEHSYIEFRKQLANLNWQFGISPLAHSNFNRVKSDIKLFEYLDSGILPIASNFGPYAESKLQDHCLLIDRASDWYLGFERCMQMKPEIRLEMVLTAQRKMQAMSYLEARSDIDLLIKDLKNATV